MAQMPVVDTEFVLLIRSMRMKPSHSRARDKAPGRNYYKFITGKCMAT